jgi:hypothetical protein
VATTAESYSLKRGPAKPPISTHPAFPAITALWFAALLGFGSLVLPIALLERLVAMTGIAALVPSAAPPLGFTAHAAIALVGGIAGAALGLLLARRIALAHAADAPPRSFADEDEAQPLRPFFASEELGEEGLAEPSPLPHRRRPLAIAEDDALLPDHSEGTPDEPLELATFGDLDEAEEPMPETEPDPALEALPGEVHASVEPSWQDEPMTDPSSFEPSSNDGADGKGPAFEPFAQPRSAADAREPLPFAPPSLRRLDVGAFADDEAEEDIPAAEEEYPVPQLAVVEAAGPGFAGDGPEVDRPLEELGLVQLAARLGASLEKRRALAAQRPAMAAPAPIAPDDAFEAAEPEEAARAMADFFAPRPAVEPADSESESAAPVAPLSLSRFAPSDDEDDEDEDEDEDDDEAEYSSLLGMTNPLARQPEFVRAAATETPAEDFARPFDPPQDLETWADPAAPRDAADAERSLRDALATLQRLSGAA